MFWISRSLKRRLKKAHSEVPIQDRLCLEVLELLSSCFVQARLPLPEFEDPLKNLECLKIHTLAHNDIILRLCKFRDADPRSVSFDQVLKARKKAMSQEEMTQLKRRISEYRALTQNLEQHRDTYIAHISKRDRTHLRPLTEIRGAVRAAVEIADMLAGERSNFTFNDVDLRAEALRETSP